MSQCDFATLVAVEYLRTMLSKLYRFRVLGLIVGYVMAYAPSAYLVKHAGLPPLTALPVVAMGSAVTMVVIYTMSALWRGGERGVEGSNGGLNDGGWSGWGLWRYARWGPGAKAGLATSVIFLSTYYAYALPTVSILLMAALMKGAVLLLAPAIDLAQGRRIRVGSAVALLLSGVGVLAGCGRGGVWLPLGALGALALYVGGYLVKLLVLGQLKNKAAKHKPIESKPAMHPNHGRPDLPPGITHIGPPIRISHDKSATTYIYAPPQDLKTFVWSEQPWIAGAALGALALLAPANPDVAHGWGLWFRADLWLAGALTQLTGIFSGFILTGQSNQEHSYCVPLNRCAGVIAGLGATLLGGGWPRSTDLLSAGCVVMAIVFLSLRRSE